MYKRKILIPLTVICQHIFPICFTTAFILIFWIVITLPMAGVFIIDGIDSKTFVYSYAYIIFYATCVGLTISIFIMFPLTLFAKRFTVHRKPLIIIIPGCLLIISGLCLVGQYLLTKEFWNTIFGWSGKLIAFLVIFTVYWSSYWLSQAIIFGFRKLTKKNTTTC